MGVSFPWGPAANTIDNPLENTHVFAKSGPKKLAMGIFAKPVHVKDAGCDRKGRCIFIQWRK